MNTKTTKDFLIDNFKIDENVIDSLKNVRMELKDQFEELDGNHRIQPAKGS